MIAESGCIALCVVSVQNGKFHCEIFIYIPWFLDHVHPASPSPILPPSPIHTLPHTHRHTPLNSLLLPPCFQTSSYPSMAPPTTMSLQNDPVFSQLTCSLHVTVFGFETRARRMGRLGGIHSNCGGNGVGQAYRVLLKGHCHPGFLAHSGAVLIPAPFIWLQKILRIPHILPSASFCLPQTSFLLLAASLIEPQIALLASLPFIPIDTLHISQSTLLPER